MAMLTFDQARVWRFGSDIDTDVLAPGAYMKHNIDVIARHCLESVRPEFASQVKAGDVLVAGPNFGIGSSREQAAGALVHLGVRAVIAPSFSGLFFRNAFNLGLLLLTCEQALQLQEGDAVRFDGENLHSTTDKVLPCKRIPDFLMDMVQAGGLLHVLKQQAQQAAPRG